MTAILSWEHDRKEIVKVITGVRARLKIVLKTKNDRHLLSEWIEHHSHIVGIENIIIFDNESDQEEVIKIYDKYGGLLVVSFGGFHNDIHAPSKFHDLWSALVLSSYAYTLLDTDEFLVHIDGSGVCKGADILEKLPEASIKDILPTVWLYNKPLSRDIFICGTDLSKLQHGLIWGKPIFFSSSSLRYAGYVNHNCDAVRARAIPEYSSGFFLLHMAHLHLRQRIEVNREKLINRGFVSRAESYEVIIKKDLTNASSNERLYVNEIAECLRLEKARWTQNDQVTTGTFRIDDRSLVFSAESDRQVFLEFTTNFPKHAMEILLMDS